MLRIAVMQFAVMDGCQPGSMNALHRHRYELDLELVERKFEAQEPAPVNEAQTDANNMQAPVKSGSELI